MSRWREWHRAYDDRDSPLAQRLAIVQGCIADALDRAAPGPVRVVSMCAGEARDLLGVIDHHPRGADVVGRLVELDPELARRARAAAPARIEVTCADGSSTSAYEGAVPADLVLVCGVFGNIGDDDIVRTIRTVPSLCAPGATAIWTRHRRPPDRTVLARDAFREAGFAEIGFESPEGFLFGVGVEQLVAQPPPFAPGIEMFTFVG
ncbi:MAG TPA: SAM-dependent methyltransferase [Acidimicrobiia bacterium]